MAKKDKDSELDAWRLRYPSAGVSWNLTGDPAYCQKFVGEAKNMLYRLKNRMNIAVPKLKSLQDIRLHNDGTMIIVKSVFGQDFVEISGGAAGVGIYSCSITLLNIPETIPPMRNPGEILPEEVEGVDYFKTYYRVDISKCSKCGELFSGDDFSNVELLFEFADPPGIEYFDGVAENHCIVSADRGCHGEIIDFGRDSGGSYFRWKAYTEGGFIDSEGEPQPFNRSGWGFFLLRASIKAHKKAICSSQHLIQVDCCERKDLQEAKIYWEKALDLFVKGEDDCQDPFEYKGMTLCKTPALFSLTKFLDFGGGKFYAIPEIGGCPIYLWSFSGDGSLVPDPLDELKQIATYQLPAIPGCRDILVSMVDRCNDEPHMVIGTCCNDPELTPLSITYTSLVMGFSESQTLYAVGGCKPYVWSLSGGGTIEPNPDGDSAVYTSPSSNPDCANNANITLTDCCENSATIQIVVTGGAGVAGYYWEWEKTAEGDCVWGLHYCVWRIWRTTLNCDGTNSGPIVNTYPAYSTLCEAPSSEGSHCGYPWVGGSLCAEDECWGGYWRMFETRPIGCVGGLSGVGYHHEACDCRNAVQKLNGCCLMNPFTGLPCDGGATGTCAECV